MASKEKDTTGIWMEINTDLKALVDFVIQLSGKTRKDYVTELIEDDVYHRLNSIPGIENMLATLETRFPDSNYVETFDSLKERVNAREVKAVAMPADIPTRF